MKFLISLLFFSVFLLGVAALAQTAEATDDKTPGASAPENAGEDVLSPQAVNGHFWSNGVGALQDQRPNYPESKKLDMSEEHCRGLVTGFDPGTLNDPPTEAALVAPATGGGVKRDN